MYFSGPFSKTAVNFNAGCKTAMSNVVMALCMLLTLLFLAPVFSYTPLVALSAIIMSAMLGLIEYEKAYHLFKTDKYDFCICMVGFFGVAFISMDIGLMLSVRNISPIFFQTKINPIPIPYNLKFIKCNSNFVNLFFWGLGGTCHTQSASIRG